MATVDLKAVITAQDKASGVLKSFADNTRSSFVTLGASVAKFGAIGVTAIAGAGVAAIKSAADMQMLRSSLDTLTGSAENGAKIFKQLNQFAAKTPFETTDLAKATQTMLGFGIQADKAIDYLKMLGDVSLGDSNKLQGLSLAFSQVKSTGRLMGQDLLQMINNGFNPLNEISKKTGKSMGELKKEMESGAISADMVTEAFMSATQEGGLFYQGMDRGSRTFNGVISTLKDNIFMTARAIVGLSDTGEVVKGGLFDKVSLAVQQLIVWLEQNKQTIIDVSVAFMNNLLTAIQFVINIFIEIGKFFMQHKDLAQSLAIAVGVTLAGAFLYWAAVTIAAAWPILAIIAAITAVVFAIKYLISHWGAIQGFFSGLGEIAGRVAQGIKNAFSNIGQAIVNGIKYNVNLAIKMVNGLIRGFNKLPAPNIPEIPLLAKGGPVRSGMPYIVGEKGPELFVPNNSGKIVPNDKIGGGASVTVNIGELSVRTQADIEYIGREIGRQVNLALKGSY